VRWKLTKMEHPVPEICSRTDGLTVRQTDTVITILRCPISGGVTNNHFITIVCRLFTLHVGSGSSIQAPSLPARWLWPGGKTLICRRRHNTLLNELVFVVGCVPRRVVVKRMPNVHKTWHGPCVKMAKSELINRAIDRSCGRTIASEWNNLWPRLMYRSILTLLRSSSGQSRGSNSRFLQLQTHISKLRIHRVTVSVPVGFRRHLVGKTLRNVCYSIAHLSTLCWQVDDHVGIFFN